jgi:NitT/TauT family transport system substrate-binding protein
MIVAINLKGGFIVRRAVKILMKSFWVVLLVCAVATAHAEAVLPELSEADRDYVIKLGYYDCDHMTAAPVAEATGIYRDLGLKVAITGNGKVPEAMAAAQMDVGYVSNTSNMRAFVKGAPILIAANNHIGGSYYLVVSNNITSSADIVGKKMSLGAEPEHRSLSWVHMARRLNVPLEGSNYEVFNMSDRDEYFAMKVGKLDGYTACDPWASMAVYEKTGYIMEADLPSKLPKVRQGICCAYSMRRAFVNEHPSLAKRMIVAHVKALQYIYTNPAHSAELFAKAYNVPFEVGLMTIYMKTVQEGRTLTWEINRQNWESEIEEQMGIGNLEEAPDLDKYLQPQYMAECDVDDFGTFIREKVDPIFPVGMSYEDWKVKAYEVEGRKPE